MSNKFINRAWEVKGLKVTERLILLRLADQADQEGRCYPAFAHLVHACGISLKSVERGIKSLRDLGHIQSEPFFINGRQSSNTYRLTIKRQIVGGEVPHTDGGEVPQNVGTSESSVESPYESNTATEDGCDKISENHSDTEGENLENSKLKGSTLVAELILKKNTVEKSLAKCAGYLTSGKLATLWKELNLIYHPNMFHPPQGKKQSGQCSHLIKKIGDKKDARQVTLIVVRHWVDFGKFVKNQGLCWDFPDNPDLGWYLSHVNSAVDFSMQDHKKQVTQGLKEFKPF